MDSELTWRPELRPNLAEDRHYRSGVGGRICLLGSRDRAAYDKRCRTQTRSDSAYHLRRPDKGAKRQCSAGRPAQRTETVPARLRRWAGCCPPEPLTDLRQEFTRLRGVTRSPFDLPQSRQGGTNGAAVPLLVLIDDGDGSAQEMGRSLKANGVTRYVVLAGGERVLARKGRTGTGRASSTIVVHRPPGSSLTTTNR